MFVASSEHSLSSRRFYSRRLQTALLCCLLCLEKTPLSLHSHLVLATATQRKDEAHNCYTSDFGSRLSCMVKKFAYDTGHIRGLANCSCSYHPPMECVLRTSSSLLLGW